MATQKPNTDEEIDILGQGFRAKNEKNPYDSNIQIEPERQDA